MPFDLRSPVTEDELARLDDRSEIVQFSSSLTPTDYALLGKWFATQPAKTLRAYGSYDGSITDLDFLRHFPTLRSFQADALYHSLTNIDGLDYLPDDAQFIGLGRTKKRLSLAPLARFTELRRLYLEGQSKDIEVVSELRDLRSITLRSITLPNLALLTPLSQLRALDLKLGGTKDLTLLPELKSLDYLVFRVLQACRSCVRSYGDPPTVRSVVNRAVRGGFRGGFEARCARSSTSERQSGSRYVRSFLADYSTP